MIEEDEEVEERCLEVKGDLGGDVYEVERVVERRTKNVSGCLSTKPLVYKNIVVI